MRHFTLTAVLGCFLLSGCLIGASRGTTTTEYVNDDGVHPVQRTKVTQTANGTTFGANLPLMMNGGMYGDQYAGATVYGGYGNAGGGNAACVLHPDQCAVLQTAVIYQPPVSITSVGGGYANGGMAVSGVGGGQTSMVGPGGSGTYGESSGDPALEALLAKHEKKIAKLIGQANFSWHTVCHMILANPKSIEDAAERKDLVAGCKALDTSDAAKNDKAKVATAKTETTQSSQPKLAPAKTGEEK